jgi:TrmH family RNA methyltransferase
MRGMATREELERLRVVLVGVRNPLNIGAAARAMSNFGFMKMRVVNPYQVAFREAKSAVGASELLAKAEEFKSVAEAVADCTLVVGTTAVGKRELQHPLKALEDGVKVMRKRMASSKVALLFGSEKIGLTNEELSHCHWLMRIPTRVEHRSMNLGQAVAICLYEIARGTGSGRVGKKKVATAGDVERIAVVMLEALEGSLYSRPGASKVAEEKLRRMLRRMELSPNDAVVLLGMMRQILWKLKNGEEKNT